MRPTKVNLSRKQMIQMFSETHCAGRVAEIGVLRGAFSKVIYENLAPAELYLIDPWAALPPEEYGDYQKYSQSHWDKMADGVAKKFCGDDVKIIRELSSAAAIQFPDDFFDVIYLDANHSYESVLNDLKAWYPKLKTGGYMSGHDIDQISVKRAVVEFVGGIDFKITKERICTSYFWTKG